MRSARPYLFGEDFRGPRSRVDGDAAREAFEQGLAEGRRQAEAESDRRLADATERLGLGLAAGVGRADAVAAAIEEDALTFFGTLARKLAGEALADRPIAAVAEAGLAAFRHLRGVPHLVARVNEALVEDCDRLLQKLGRETGFEGRIVVIGDDAMVPGDARFEWADGGIARCREDLEQALAKALSAAAQTGERS